MIKVGINGFGRIGRLTLRALMERKVPVEVAAVNDLTDTRTNAHLFKYDSSYGRYPGTVDYADDEILVDGKGIKVLAERDPAKIGWRDYGIDIVIESTGLFTDGEKAAAHKQGGARKIIISAPANNVDVTLVLGVNENKYDRAKHDVISNASCTTNGIAPVLKVINDKFGILRGFMTTIHAYTGDQRLLDMAHKDLRRARAAAVSLVPSTTGAARAIGLVIPELEGKMNGIALRMPTPAVSVADLVMNVERETDIERVNQAIKTAAEGQLKGILEYCDEPLVSIDFKGNPASAILDAENTMVAGGNLVKVLSWYDNEWGYSCRLADLVAFIVRKGV
ncbi:type I glyceraldehyde-3-phosphate dehydrogenase [Chloroflexota bacterium]